MKTLILAAGYATRLYPLTKDMPKPLLKLGNRPIIDYIIQKIKRIEGMREILVISNQKFYCHFKEWLASKDRELNNIRLINDGSTSVNNRRGAVGDINLAIKQKAINDDLLIVAGDNLFDFDLAEFIRFAEQNKPYHSICLYHLENEMDLTRFGIVSLNGDFEIVNFEEKPAVPKSDYIATCIYFFPKEKLNLVSEYLSDNHYNDTPGSYISWLVQNDKVFGKVFSGTWFDLGDFDSLTLATIHINGNGIKSLRNR